MTDWVTEKIIIKEGSYAGPYQHRVPASVPIYEAIEQTTTRIVVIRSPVQMMKTQICINSALYFAAVEPCPILFFEPTEELARSISKGRISPIAMEIPELAVYWKGASIAEINFLNGSMSILSAHGRMATKSRPARIVIADEWRAMPTDIMAGIKGRQTTFDKRGAKTIVASSAGDEGSCRISDYWQASDRRIWHVPCGECGVMQPLEWDRVKWENNDAMTARYHCAACDAQWNNEELAAVQIDGEYIATAQTTETGLIGFHANSLANTMIRMSTLVDEWITANNVLRWRGDSSQIADFQRDRLAVPWRPDTQLEPEQLDNTLRINYPKAGLDLPAWVVALTMAVDVQDDRLEYEIAGWGIREVETETDATAVMLGGRLRSERFIVNNRFYQLRRCGVFYGKVVGDPATDYPWAEILSIYRSKTGHSIGDPGFPRTANPAVLLIDSGGNHTQNVIRFCYGQIGKRIFPIKGIGRFGKPLIAASTGKQNQLDYGNQLYLIGTNAGKEGTLSMVRYSRFAKESMKTMMFPNKAIDRGYNLKYFGGLVSERKAMVTNKVTGQQKLAFIKRHNVANEPLDLAVYNLAAVYWIGYNRLLSMQNHVEKTRAENAKKLSTKK